MRLYIGSHAVALHQAAPVLDLAPVFFTLGATCLGKEKVSMPCGSGRPCLEHFEFLAAHGNGDCPCHALHVVLGVLSSCLCIAGALEAKSSQGRELDHGWQVLPHVALGPWQCLHDLGCHLLTPVSSTRSWQVQLSHVIVCSSRHSTASSPAGICHLGLCRWPGAGAVCRWVGCCSYLHWLCLSVGALMQLKPPSPLGWQLQTHCRIVPQVVCLHLFSPPSLANPASQSGQIDLLCHVLGGLSLWHSLRPGLTEAVVGSAKWVQLSHCCP